MKIRFASAIAGLLAFMIVIPTIVSATSVKHMNIDELSRNADKIFRGTVISVRQGSVEAGGAQLPTLTYTLKVEESFKGNFTSEKGDMRLTKITMVSDSKAESSGDIRRMTMFRDLPRLAVGGDYLLFTSAESKIGLSMTIGLDQGCFDVVGSMALNRAGNQGLFQGAASTGPAKGAIAYNELSDRIRAILATQ